MTTVAQVRQVTRPLLERNSDLALVGRLVVVTPVRHLLRGIFFGKGTDPVIFDPTWFVNFLFKPEAGVSDTWGEQLRRKRRIPLDDNDRAASLARMHVMLSQMTLPVRARRYPKSWGGWVAHDPAIAAEMCEAIEQEALPMLRGLQSIDDFIAFTSDQARFPLTYFGSNHFNEPFVHAARGDLDAVLALCGKLGPRHSARPQVKDLLPLVVDGDRHALAQRLIAWEADSVKRLKLEKLWERTPFPIEAAV